jgi:Ice-binding-like/Bacterial Ig-like domain
MNGLTSFRRYAAPLAAVALTLLAAACSGSRGPILGTGANAELAPTVTSTTPANQVSGVVLANPSITATLSQAVSPISGAASFTVTCVSPCTSPTGTVTLDATNTIATFTLTAGTTLEPIKVYTATVTGAKSIATGLTMQAPYVWTFSTEDGPTVTAVSPVNLATGVATNDTIVSAAFSEPMAPFTGAASFTLTCAAPCANATGTVVLNSDSTIASFTLTPATTLAANTTYTATVSGAKSLATGLPMTAPYVWSFTTGSIADSTRPTVTLTNPVTTTPGPTTGVPANTAVSAAFSEDMDPNTISTASFTLTCAAPCVAPAGTVSYALGTRTAVFTPGALLTVGAVYTATVTMAATDLAGNALAGNQAALPAPSNYVWTFTAAAAAPPSNVSVMSTNPAAGAAGVCPSASINATFTVPSRLRMDPDTLTTATFTVTGPPPTSTPVAASSVVVDNATGLIATFTPASPLTAGLMYTANLKGGVNGVTDTAIPANDMLANFSWTFTVGAAGGNCVAAPSLGSAAVFGDIGGTAGMTNQGTLTVINGDIGTTAVSTGVTGFHDTTPQCIYTETGSNIGTVNGLIYTAAPPPTVGCPGEGTAVTFKIAQDAAADTLTAYNALVAEPAGPDPGAGNLANMTLPPGVYTAASGSFLIEGGNLTLDAQGNANAVWVFQMAEALTVGGPGAAFPQSVLLINGAQPKNVFWQVGSHATINAAGGGTMSGTIISQAGVSVSTVGNTTITTVNGRLLSLGASVTLVDTVVNVPAP